MSGLFEAFWGCYESSRLKRIIDAASEMWAVSVKESRILRWLYWATLPKQSLTYSVLTRPYYMVKSLSLRVGILGRAYRESRFVKASAGPWAFALSLILAACSIIAPPVVRFIICILLCVYAALGGVNAMAFVVFICPFFPPLPLVFIVSFAALGHILRLMIITGYGRPPTPLDVLVLIFGASVIFSSVSLFSVPALLGGALPFLSLALFYIAVTGGVTKKEDWEIIAFSFIISAAAVSILNVIHLFGEGTPVFQQTILAIILSVALGAAADKGPKKAGAYALGAAMLISLIVAWPGGALTTAAVAFLMFVLLRDSRFFMPVVIFAFLVAAILPVDAWGLWQTITSETSKTSLNAWDDVREVLMYYRHTGLQNVVRVSNRAVFTVLAWSEAVGFLAFALLTAIFFIEASLSLNENKNAFFIALLTAVGGGVSGLLFYGFDGGSLMDYNLIGGFWIFTAIIASWAYITQGVVRDAP